MAHDDYPAPGQPTGPPNGPGQRRLHRLPGPTGEVDATMTG